ncbi:WD40 repeat domain-containing protein [Capsulimonas sp.]|uniref:WD40 repeat domain-containing protein n=1 Tax=Capsulimonas sp. TaxID=2494211 RepID=UPI003266568C
MDAVAVTPDGKFVIGAVDNYEAVDKEFERTQKPLNKWPGGKIYVWDLQTQKCVRTFTAFNEAIFSMAVSPDGTKLATDELRYASIWDIPSGKLIWRKTITCGKQTFSANSKTLLFSGYTLDIATKTLHPLPGGLGKQSTLTLSPDQTVAATIDENYKYTKAPHPERDASARTFIKGGRPHLWERTTGIERYELPYDKTNSIAFSPDGSTLASISSISAPKSLSGSIGRILRLTDIRTKKIIWEKTWDNSDSGLLSSLVSSRSGNTIAVEDWAHRISLIDAHNGHLIRRITPYLRIDTSKPGMMTPTGLAFSGDGKLLVSCADHAVCVWDTQDVK